MGTTARKTMALMLGLLLSGWTPYPGTTTAQADPGCGQHGGCGCEHAYPDAGQAGAGPPGTMHDNTMSCPDCMHRKMHGGGGHPPMRATMEKHMEEMRTTVGKLREIETKMAGQIKDGESFRKLALEHAKLLTDLQASHLAHMERMMGGGK